MNQKFITKLTRCMQSLTSIHALSRQFKQKKLSVVPETHTCSIRAEKRAYIHIDSTQNRKFSKLLSKLCRIIK